MPPSLRQSNWDSITMADHTPRYRSYHPDIFPYDENLTGRRVTPYKFGQSARTDHPEDSVPLFLSDYDCEPDPGEYITPVRKHRTPSVSSLVVPVAAGRVGGEGPVAAAPVVATPVADQPARKLDGDELATLFNRGKGLLAGGDITSARLLLERAADAQEPGAALMLARTYDPDVLGTQDARNIIPDPAMARAWYQKAAQFGSADARRRLAQMQN